MDDETISETTEHLSENEGNDTEQELETTDEEIDRSERRFLQGNGTIFLYFYTIQKYNF